SRNRKSCRNSASERRAPPLTRRACGPATSLPGDPAQAPLPPAFAFVDAFRGAGGGPGENTKGASGGACRRHRRASGGTMTDGFVHLPVMVAEVTELLAAVPPGLAVDATVGGGGHAAALLTARPDLYLLGIDRDPVAVAAAGAALEPFGDRVRIVQGGFEKVADIVGNEEIVAILFDLR